ncbi:MAG: hypothetical protein Q9208_000427 [Pyrenodesmia sp. 3 TL-2023]
MSNNPATIGSTAQKSTMEKEANVPAHGMSSLRKGKEQTEATKAGLEVAASGGSSGGSTLGFGSGTDGGAGLRGPIGSAASAAAMKYAKHHIEKAQDEANLHSHAKPEGSAKKSYTDAPEFGGGGADPSNK